MLWLVYHYALSKASATFCDLKNPNASELPHIQYGQHHHFCVCEALPDHTIYFRSLLTCSKSYVAVVQKTISHNCKTIQAMLTEVIVFVLYLDSTASLIKIIPQTQFSYRRGLTGMAYRSSSRDFINLHIETKYWPMRFDITKAFSVVRSKWRRLTQPSL